MYQCILVYVYKCMEMYVISTMDTSCILSGDFSHSVTLRVRLDTFAWKASSPGSSAKFSPLRTGKRGYK